LEKWDATIYFDFLLCNVRKVVDGALAPSESVFPKLAGTEKSPSELNTSINLIDLLQMVAEATSAHAPSQFRFKNRSTINWKLAIEVEAIINLNAWRVVGANHASSKIDMPIKLRNKIGVILCVLFELRDLAHAANREAQLDLCWLGPKYEMAFDDQTSTKTCCSIL
jgi:hypothetical protein